MMYLMVYGGSCNVYRFNGPEFDLSQKTLIYSNVQDKLFILDLGVHLQGTEEGFLDVFLTLVAFPTFRFKRFFFKSHLLTTSIFADIGLYKTCTVK